MFKPPNPFAPKTEEEYQAKLDALASAITRMEPHVSAVQEVGDPRGPAVQGLGTEAGALALVERAESANGKAQQLGLEMGGDEIDVGVLDADPHV